MQKHLPSWQMLFRLGRRTGSNQWGEFWNSHFLKIILRNILSPIMIWQLIEKFQVPKCPIDSLRPPRGSLYCPGRYFYCIYIRFNISGTKKLLNVSRVRRSRWQKIEKLFWTVCLRGGSQHLMWVTLMIIMIIIIMNMIIMNMMVIRIKILNFPKCTETWEFFQVETATALSKTFWQIHPILPIGLNNEYMSSISKRALFWS